MPIASEIAQPIVPAHERTARHAVLDQLEPGEEEQEHEPEVGEEVDVAVDLREAEPLRADEDPEHDLETTVGRTIRLCSLDRIAPALAAARTSTSEPASGIGASAAAGASRHGAAWA